MESDQPPAPPARLPSWLKWMLFGAIYGVMARAGFGGFPTLAGVMTVAFLLVAPFAIGALAVYGARGSKPSILVMILMPWLSIGLMLFGCVVTLMEGAICIALMAPLFLGFGSLGGLAMGLALRYSGRHAGKLPSVAVLPFLMLFGEQSIPLENRELELKQSIVISAEPHTVWLQIVSARAITPAELPLSLTYLIGIPRPMEGVNVVEPQGEVRYAKWERGVNFRAIVSHKVPNQSITWQYVFDDKSFPPGSMDDHVAIGSTYFDLHDTTFTLSPLTGGRTRLDLVSHYRVNTNINFYAVPVAAILGNDLISSLLTMYKNRSERAAGHVSQRG
jgi:hypothetical protein